MTWRDRCAPIIQQVLCQTKGQTEREIRKALREAYPFGERVMWPYKVWLDEIKRQRGLKPAVHTGRLATRDCEGQQFLFDHGGAK